MNVQYAFLSFADPFGAGWAPADRHRHVTVSFLSDFTVVPILWKLQAAGVVAGGRRPEHVARVHVAVQPNLSVAQYVVTEDFLARHPETVKRFNAALHMGIEWVSKHLGSKELRDLLSGYTKISPELLSKMSPLVDPPRKVDAESIRKTIALMKSHELLTGDVNAESLLAPSAR